MQKTVVILGGKRTAFAEWVGGKKGSGEPGGALKDVSAIELGALTARGAMEATGIEPARIDHVVFGNAMQTSADAVYGARHVALKAGVPDEVPALTVNRACGSGLQAVVDAAHVIEEGASYVLAGGMENMSQAPFAVRGARTGIRLGRGELEDTLLSALRDAHCGMFMAETSDRLARQMGITREEQDEYALRSIQLGERAAKSGWLAGEIIPVEVQSGKRTHVVDSDDHYFVGATAEGLAALPPAFGKDGFVTAGNASGIVDGAGCLVVADADVARADGVDAVAEVRGWHVVGVDPTVMGIAPVAAVRGVLDKCRLTLEDIDRFEINEAFAGQYLAVEKELGLDRSRVNVNGGAIAIGHPLGATGVRLLLALTRELVRGKMRYGVAAACIGGGQGIAMLVENATLS